VSEFEARNAKFVEAMGEDRELAALTQRWFQRASSQEYSYHFRWMGRPIIQFPQDIVAMQELIWDVQPDVIIETGVAHGGSLVFYASMLELLGGDRRVVGIDIEIRPHNREALDRHPRRRRIDLIEGDSTSPAVLAQVKALAAGRARALVVLDSNHTHAHVRKELELYSPFVKRGSYLVVFDTVIERLTPALIGARPWAPGNSPWTAVQDFLASDRRFEVDRAIHDKLQITVAPDGYLRCVAD